MQTDKNRSTKSILLAVTMASHFSNPLMGAAVNVALPRISAEFSLDAVTLSWVSMSFLLSLVVFLVPFGKIADIVGRKRIFLYGNFFFLPATLLCAVAPSGAVLILARLLQGAGSAMMFSTTMAIVISAFPPKDRGKVIGYNVSAVYLGLSTAPLLGGYLTQTFGWRSLFYLNAGISILIILAILWQIREEWVEAGHEKFDWAGTLVYIPAMAVLMYGFSKLPAASAVACVIGGFAGMAVFIRLELRHPFPILNMKLFIHNRMFAGANLSAFINYAATFAVTFVLSLYLQYAWRLTPKETGAVLIIQPIVMAVMAAISGRLSDGIQPRRMASFGMAISALCLFFLSRMMGDSPLAYLYVTLGLLGTGFGLFSSPNTNMVMSSVEKRYYGVASAAVSTMRSMGMMFSMAVAALVLHVYIGEEAISDRNIGRFLHSARIIFLIFTAFCLVGVFTSLAAKNPPPADTVPE